MGGGRRAQPSPAPRRPSRPWRGDPSALAEELPLTRQAVTKHLAVLDRAGLVEARRQGREVRYVVRPERLDAATQAMAMVAARWDQRLQAIKHLAEAAHREEHRDQTTKETDA